MDINLAIPNEGMFERIGLTESPFPVTPDARHYFCSQRLESHVLELMHCIHMRKGFLLFTADIGLGKSTLSRYLINHLEEQKTDVSLVLNTFLQGVELLKAINEDFGLTVEGGVKAQLDALNGFLLQQYQQQRNCLIIIDDAQNLSTESLEMIRLISNFEVSTDKLVQILLIAQPEIMLTLNLPQIRQLKSRIALHIELEPFTEQEVLDYVYFRLNSAQNYYHIQLTQKAGKKLHQLSKGYPRRINLIMDRALYALLVDATTIIDDKLITLANNDIEQTPYMRGIQQAEFTKHRYQMYAASIALLSLISIAVWQFTPDSWVHKLSLQPLVADSQASLAIDKPSRQVVVIEKPLEVEKVNKAKDVATHELPGLVTKEISRPGNKGNNNNEFTNEVLTPFLQHYGLHDDSGALARTLQQENWLAFQKQIAQHGWQLLMNEKPFVEPPREVMELVLSNQTKRWVMLWQPQLQFNKFHFGLQSPEVATLQKLLKQEGFFNNEEDATIGSKTMYAIANFQRSLNLE
ncbi:MAG: AAA family ATPase, partial [Thiomicrorhabdus sp.]|nr:AAA family ATPase [Thiomicrorhabdus sp.]